MRCEIRLRGNFPVKFNCGHVLTVCVVLLCAVSFSDDTFGVFAEEDGQRPPANTNSENHVSQVRYRTRPVAAFRSTKSSNSTTNSSSEADSPEPSGVPFIAVHELTSQTFEKLHENWRNLETFIKNLQARRSQEENSRSSSSQNGRPPYNSNNVYTFKYHPVVLEGEGSPSTGDTIRSSPPRNLNGNYHFNPFLPYDKGQPSKNTEIERHTVATIYTIGICLTIMAIGSVMFILINKCDTGGSNYVRTTTSASGGNRITRSVIGAAARAGRQINSGRGRSSRRGRNSNNNDNGNLQTLPNSVNTPASGGSENEAKVLTDLPPSYDSLFPEGGPKDEELPPPPVLTASNQNESTATV